MKRAKLPENRQEVSEIVDSGELHNLHDAEEERMRRELSERVYARREELGLTQEDLAEITGLSERTISYIERKGQSPGSRTIVLLAEGLRVTTDYLLGLRTQNYDDIMQDPKAAHLMRMFLRFTEEDKAQILFYAVENFASLFGSRDKASTDAAERIAHLEQLVGRLTAALDIEKKPRPGCTNGISETRNGGNSAQCFFIFGSSDL